MFVVGAVCLAGVLSSASAGVTQAAIRVQGNTTCPTADQVESALVGMVPPSESATAPDVIVLTGDRTSADGTPVSVRLESSTGERIAERRLPAAKSCAERAQAAAVIVAAWEVRIHGGTQPSLPSFGGARATEPAVAPVATESAPALEPAPAPVPTRAPAVSSRSSAVAVAPAIQPSPPSPPPSPPPLVQLEIGGEVLTSMVASDVGRGALIELRAARPDSVLAGAVSGLGLDAHIRQVGSGQGRWRRLGGIVDLRSVARWRPAELELRLGLAVTGVAIAGQAFPVTQGATLFDPGGVAGLRARFRLGRWVAWTDATAAFWPRAHNLYVTGDSASADLPSVELWLGVGLSLLVRR